MRIAVAHTMSTEIMPSKGLEPSEQTLPSAKLGGGSFGSAVRAREADDDWFVPVSAPRWQRQSSPPRLANTDPPHTDRDVAPASFVERRRSRLPMTIGAIALGVCTSGLAALALWDSTSGKTPAFAAIAPSLPHPEGRAAGAPAQLSMRGALENSAREAASSGLPARLRHIHYSPSSVWRAPGEPEIVVLEATAPEEAVRMITHTTGQAETPRPTAAESASPRSTPTRAVRTATSTSARRSSVFDRLIAPPEDFF